MCCRRTPRWGTGRKQLTRSCFAAIWNACGQKNRKERCFLTKKELCVQVSRLTNVPQYGVEIVVKAMLACIEKALVNEDTVRLSRFGQFSTSRAALDVSRNLVYAEAGV